MASRAILTGMNLLRKLFTKICYKEAWLACLDVCIYHILISTTSNSAWNTCENIRNVGSIEIKNPIRGWAIVDATATATEDTTSGFDTRTDIDADIDIHVDTHSDHTDPTETEIKTDTDESTIIDIEKTRLTIEGWHWYLHWCWLDTSIDTHYA